MIHQICSNSDKMGNRFTHVSVLSAISCCYTNSCLIIVHFKRCFVLNHLARDPISEKRRRDPRAASLLSNSYLSPDHTRAQQTRRRGCELWPSPSLPTRTERAGHDCNGQPPHVHSAHPIPTEAYI